MFAVRTFLATETWARLQSCLMTVYVQRKMILRSVGPLTEDSCLPILQPGSEMSWDSACSWVRTPEGRHHLVPVMERQGGAGAFLPPFSQGNAGQADPGSSWLPGCLAQAGATHHATVVKGPVTLRRAGLLPPRCAADCLWEDGWRHILYTPRLSGTCAAWVQVALMLFEPAFIVGRSSARTVKVLTCRQLSATLTFNSSRSREAATPEEICSGLKHSDKLFLDAKVSG